MEKRRNSPLFHSIFKTLYISNFRSQITYSFVKCGCWIYFFLDSAILICRGTDISKYFRDSLELRNNKRGLYYKTLFCETKNYDMQNPNSDVQAALIAQDKAFFLSSKNIDTSTDSKRAVVSFWRNNVHNYWLTTVDD